ncbi:MULTISPECIES: acetolactate synthase 2 small subunit [unclassified Gilliamella]|uniref:acetolactate synthase 2 small subunit n=1 Tax=unclassified Gilliamella TaxID=2685620 RepID=UPI001C6A2206|nr:MULTISPECIES: acetolactate synthase 2 small subunit [unclassified Gilliamella]MCX8600650.1 acetolactate synthase 2 small subunit [Gilliamella sp. B3722]MCX8609190.1 acetolactate synthase 2 small subunit [Gilliamella sp. B3771]MCX8609867.1 acetolactate synthase 2 small subunit [Gilliamella sp. B3891]MCX8612043.1 acetolactate synthase 2 small subunit [Gilliamella sp. B3773]MCX8615547.1 acetolactate synthase 2 small subunit [Gilliamella sp. B3770]
MNTKTQYQVTIKAYDKLGSLERILRVVRHRGGHIEKMQMQTVENEQLILSLLLTTERSLSTLQNQVAKLADVIAVE